MVHGFDLRIPTAQRMKNIGGNVLRRTIDQQPAIVYTFPPNTMIRSGQRLTLWASGRGSSPDSLVFGAIQTWGNGRKVVTTLEENGQVRARYTREIEQNSVEQQGSMSLAISGGSSMLLNGGGVRHEASYSSLSHSRGSAHHDLSGGHHSSSSAYEASSGGYGGVQRSEGTTLYQQKIVSTGGDEFDFLDDHQHGDASLDNHESSTSSLKTMEASSFVAGGGNDGEIVNVTSLVGKFEQGGQQQQQQTHKTYKYRRDQKTWDHGESNL